MSGRSTAWPTTAVSPSRFIAASFRCGPRTSLRLTSAALSSIRSQKPLHEKKKGHAQSGPKLDKSMHSPFRTAVHPKQVALVCEHCGLPFFSPRSTGRPLLFCSAVCRKRAFRARKWDRRYPTTVGGTKRLRRPLKSKADFQRFCRSNPPSISGPQAVIEREIIANRDWQSVTSPDGVICQVTRVRR